MVVLYLFIASEKAHILRQCNQKRLARICLNKTRPLRTDCSFRFPEQKSKKIFLMGGRYYFIRVYMKAEKLGDCASVAVEFPSGHFEGPIKKKHLSWKIASSSDGKGPGPKEIIESRSIL